MRFIALAASAVLLQACRSKEPLLAVEPGKADIAGHYRLAEVAFGGKADSEIKAKAASSYIDLRDDGTLTFHDVPVVAESSGPAFSVDRFHSGDGTYTIAPLGSTSKSEFYGLYIDCGPLPDPVDTPRLRGSGGSLTLSFEYFDGDFVQRMTFTRPPKTPAPPTSAHP